MPASASSWTRVANEDLDSADEPETQQDEDEELLFEEGRGPERLVCVHAASGRPFFWHRGSRPSVAPPSWSLLAEEEGGGEEG